MTAATPIDVKRCLGVIKQLQARNQLLTQEKDEAYQCKQQSDQKLQELQKRYDDLASKFENYANSARQCVPIEDDDLDENQHSQQNHVVENDHVKKLEDLLEQKNKEVISLQQSLQNLNQEIAQKSICEKILQETKSLTTSYIAQLDQLQSRLDGGDCHGTTAQAVSGDEDGITTPSAESHNPRLQEEVDRLKAEKEDLLSRLQPLQNVEAERDSICEQKCALGEENQRLLTEINILRTAKVADFPIESQLKVFLDDFQDERKEKEQQCREKHEIYEENQKLVVENRRMKEKLESMAHSMTDLQNQMVDWSPPHQPTKHFQPPNHAQPTQVAYERGGPLPQRVSSRLDYPQVPPMDYHMFYGASSRYYENQPSPRLAQPAAYGGPSPLNFTPGPSEAPRRIGFPPKDTPTRVPASPPLRAGNPNFPPRPQPPLNRQFANCPRPQFSPVAYMQEHIQTDNHSSADPRTLPKTLNS